MSELIINDKDLIIEEHWPAECMPGFYGGKIRARRPWEIAARIRKAILAATATPSRRSALGRYICLSRAAASSRYASQPRGLGW